MRVQAIDGAAAAFGLLRNQRISPLSPVEPGAAVPAAGKVRARPGRDEDDGRSGVLATISDEARAAFGTMSRADDGRAFGAIELPDGYDAVGSIATGAKDARSGAVKRAAGDKTGAGSLDETLRGITERRDAEREAGTADDAERLLERATKKRGAERKLGEALTEKGRIQRGDAERERAGDLEFAAVVRELRGRDSEVRAHEAAHVAAGGRFVRGGASFSLQRGPDGRMYAVGGEVGIDTSPIPGNPAATAAKMRTVRAAALAPAEPSGADHSVAAAASQEEARALAELAAKRSEEAAGPRRGDEPADVARSEPVEETDSPRDGSMTASLRPAAADEAGYRRDDGLAAAFRLAPVDEAGARVDLYA